MTLHVPNLSTDVQPNARTSFAPSENVASGPYSAFFKRTIDLTLVLISMPFVLPMVLVLALLVAILTGGRPFYSQLRVGKEAKAFRMWKLRTMVKDADALLIKHLQDNPEARAEWNSTQKLRNDPRITRIGRVLRKTSLDELPQLFNVLNGTMSLVGPRPMMVGQEDHYSGQAYYRMRPGLTGTWQVSGDRSNSEFAVRVLYDNTYEQNLSLKTDVNVLVQTVGVVLRASGN